MTTSAADGPVYAFGVSPPASAPASERASGRFVSLSALCDPCAIAPGPRVVVPDGIHLNRSKGRASNRSGDSPEVVKLSDARDVRRSPLTGTEAEAEPGGGWGLVPNP